MNSDLERRFAELIERHLADGALPDIEAIVRDHPDLAAPLRQLFDDYLGISATLDSGMAAAARPVAETLPTVPGFRTVERLGAGGMGEVYKLEDLTLHRLVAAKFVRADQQVQAALTAFLREARSLALFADPRIVRIFEFRDDVVPPVIIMEYVDGFELGRLGPSLEYPQRARILRDVCEAIQGAHDLGIQHRDLKPSNIIVDGSLVPKVLDFGLSEGDPRSGHLRGTLPYLAPEQLDPSTRLDARTDIYALGVILFELIAGSLPYDGRDTAAVMAEIRRGEPALPVELESRVPEPLQAIALKAMERNPEDRYASAREMAADLGRYLDARPVLAHPTQYAATLGARVRPHLEHIGEWLRLKLIHPHEAERLQGAYRTLDARDDDWIASSRSLSYSQIALYFGALLLAAGSLFYFAAERFFHAVAGVGRPFAVLAAPFLGLNAAGWHLYRTGRKAVAVAFLLAGVCLLPLFLLIWFHETGLWVIGPGVPGQLWRDGAISNRQLQVTVLVATVWAGWLALRTRTTALSTVFTALAFVLALSVLADAGLRSWIDDYRPDLLALHLWPVALVFGLAGAALERWGRPWFARPLYLAGALTIVAVLDLVALDGKAFHYLGITTQGLQPAGVSDPRLLDTIGALTLNGVAFYLIATLVERLGPEVMQIAAVVLFVIAPFSTLEPLAYLVENGEYSPRFDWVYLALGAVTALVSHQRQRRSFYYAGLLNTAVALYLIALHRDWFDDAFWGVSLVVVGLVVLAAGFLLDAHERRRTS